MLFATYKWNVVTDRLIMNTKENLFVLMLAVSLQQFKWMADFFPLDENQPFCVGRDEVNQWRSSEVALDQTRV